MEEYLPGMCKAVGSTPSTDRKERIGEKEFSVENRLDLTEERGLRMGKT